MTETPRRFRASLYHHTQLMASNAWETYGAALTYVDVMFDNNPILTSAGICDVETGVLQFINRPKEQDE